mgnify:CR=1 FL=1
MILHVIEASVVGPTSLVVLFNDGVKRRVNVSPLLHGSVFEPLNDPIYFATVTVDSKLGTVVWPNDADLAPEALYELPNEMDIQEQLHRQAG